MLGRMNEVIKETRKDWIKFFRKHRGFFTSPETKTNIVATLVEGKGKGIMGTPPSILKNIKIVEIEPSENTLVQTNTETPVNTGYIVYDTNSKDNFPLDINVQVEDIVPREEPTIA